jgi:hypothetical protein
MYALASWSSATRSEATPEGRRPDPSRIGLGMGMQEGARSAPVTGSVTRRRRLQRHGVPVSPSSPPSHTTGAQALRERKNPATCRASSNTANGIRTRVTAVRGRRPSPLDDGGVVLERPCRGYQRAVIARLLAAGGPGVSSVRYLRSSHHADVAELVDAHGSGPCLGDQVEVRVLSSASHKSPANWLFIGSAS